MQIGIFKCLALDIVQRANKKTLERERERNTESKKPFLCSEISDEDDTAGALVGTLGRSSLSSSSSSNFSSLVDCAADGTLGRSKRVNCKTPEDSFVDKLISFQIQFLVEDQI